MTKEFREEHQLLEYEYRYYYDFAEELLKDYEEFIQQYCNRTLKSAEQYVLDIKNIWQEIDAEMSLNPNMFRDEDNLDAKFYLPQKQLLLDNKDKDPKDQDPYIQAPTIRSKLISLNRFLNTLKQRSIYFGLTNNEVEKLQGMISQCKSNFKKFAQRKGTNH